MMMMMMIEDDVENSSHQVKFPNANSPVMHTSIKYASITVYASPTGLPKPNLPNCGRRGTPLINNYNRTQLFSTMLGMTYMHRFSRLFPAIKRKLNRAETTPPPPPPPQPKKQKQQLA